MKFSSLDNVAKPETPAQNAVSVRKAQAAAKAKELFLEAVKQAAISGVIEPTYDKLPEALKQEFSFKTFVRLAGKVL